MRFVVPLAVFVALAALLAVGLGLDPRRVPSPLIGRPAPAFSLPTLDDPARRLGPDALRGQVWLLNVWASWCAACREEHPLLVRLAREGKVPIVGLAYKDDPDASREWLEALGNPYRHVVVDRDGRAAIDWGVYGVPETFVIDARGVIRYKQIGPLTEAAWNDEVAPLIARLGSGREARP